MTSVVVVRGERPDLPEVGRETRRIVSVEPEHTESLPEPKLHSRGTPMRGLRLPWPG